jgi:hypothetical protein
VNTPMEDYVTIGDEEREPDKGLKKNQKKLEEK